MSWPSIVIVPRVGLVEAQDQVEHRRLAAAGRPDQRGHLAGLGDEATCRGAPARPADSRTARRRIRRAPSSSLQRRLVVVVGLGRRAVDDLEQDAHADQAGVEIDVEARQPLGRLVGQHEGGEEREELRPASRRSRSRGSRHRSARSAIGEAAERLHQRARAVGDARHLVGFVLDARRRWRRAARRITSSSVKALTMRMPCTRLLHASRGCACRR